MHVLAPRGAAGWWVRAELPALLLAGFPTLQREPQLCETRLLGTEPPALQSVPIKSRRSFGRVTGRIQPENEILLS